jgi:hypothetical protein
MAARERLKFSQQAGFDLERLSRGIKPDLTPLCGNNRARWCAWDQACRADALPAPANA